MVAKVINEHINSTGVIQLMIQVRKVLNQIKPYVPGKPIEEVQRELGIQKIIKLASNENPLGCSAKAKSAMQKTLENPALYPDANCTDLRNMLAKKMNLKPTQFFFGAGSDGIIEMIPKAFMNPEEESIMASITFPLYETGIILADGVCVKVPLDANYCFDLDAMAQRINEKTKIIWLCNPNNPTGTIFTKQQQEKFLQMVPKDVIVILDEAYYEYVTCETYPESLDLLKQYPNVIILRTFSKIYGLASLRVGYAISNEYIIAQLEKVRSPFNVNRFAQAAAIASLEDKEFRNLSYKTNKENKEFLYRSFEKLGLDYLPSETNFVTFDVKKDSQEVFHALLHKGFIVRPCSGYDMPTWIRVTIGTNDECKAFVHVLEEVLDLEVI